MSYPIIPIKCNALRPSNCPFGPTATDFRTVISHGDMKSARIMLGIGALLWASFLLWPYALDITLFPTPEQITAGTGTTTYAVMAQITDEWVWPARGLYAGQRILQSAPRHGFTGRLQRGSALELRHDGLLRGAL